MTGTSARIAANVILAAAGAVAAYYVITTPPLRRLAAGAIRVWLGGGVPVFLGNEIRRAWAEAGQAPVRRA
jgi:hypothetical protein